jgi:hypothetical protein
VDRLAVSRFARKGRLEGSIGSREIPGKFHNGFRG